MLPTEMRTLQEFVKERNQSHRAISILVVEEDHPWDSSPDICGRRAESIANKITPEDGSVIERNIANTTEDFSRDSFDTLLYKFTRWSPYGDLDGDFEDVLKIRHHVDRVNLVIMVRSELSELLRFCDVKITLKGDGEIKSVRKLQNSPFGDVLQVTMPSLE